MTRVSQNRHNWALLATTALALAAPASAWAQEKPIDAETPDIIVTGTSRARIALDTPLAVSQVSEKALARVSTSSQADILNSLPTIKADGGGGEVAANIFVKGLPSAGQYQFTPLMYDGIPVLSTFGLNSSAYDVYYRNDLGIERLELVRGGVSNLFGPGSVAGLINYISKTGGDHFSGVAQVEVAEKGRYKGDFAVSGPLAQNTSYALSGWYRTDDGPVKTGLDTKGFQLRGNVKFDFADNSGSVTIYGQYIDDQTQFFLPIPLDGTTRARLTGNSGDLVYSVQTPKIAGLGFNTPTGAYVNNISDGVTSKGGQVAIALKKDLGNGWGLNGRVKYSDYKHKFGLWSDGDGIINVPETLQSFLTNRKLGSVANAQFTYVGGGAVAPTDILFANRITDRDRPMHDFTAELNLTKQLTTGSVDHSLTLGGFMAKAAAKDINVTSTFVAAFDNQPKLVNITITDPVTQAKTVITRDGLYNAGAGYVNNRHAADRYAAYLADQMKIGDRFNLDIGGRIETLRGDISRERTATTITDSTTPNLSAALRDVIWGTGVYTTGKVKATEWALAAGALYKLTDHISLYANGSRGYFFPELRSATFNSAFQVQSYEPEIIKQAEAGVKMSQGAVDMTLSALYTKLTNRRQVLFVNDGAGGFTEKVNLVGTRSYGLEATLDWRILPALRFSGNVTLQNAKYIAFDATPGNIGKKVERQPNVLYNAGLYYDDGALDASLFTNYTGSNYTAASNAILLQGWNIANLDLGYKFDVQGRKVRVGVNVFNLFNTDATTEGSPRQDSNQTTGGAYFVGRPVLPRRIMGRITYNF